MTPEETFIFDLNGYIIIRNVLSAEEVAQANAAIDAHTDRFHERKGALRNTANGTPLAGDGSTGRLDMAGMLGWEKPHCDVFRQILCHEKLVPYYHTLIGKGYRLDHLPLVLGQDQGAEGFQLHGGPLTSAGAFEPTLQYRCVNGTFFNTLLAVSVQLVDHNPGDGGFCVLPGSHKLNFPVPNDIADGQKYTECLQQPVTKAGDVVIFSEATVHGCMAWTAERQRRVALYRFAPANFCYGRSYLPQWPEEMMRDLTPAQAAVMEAPYAVRLDRPMLREDGERGEAQSRAPHKKAFDKTVFGSQYF
jgi:ectoine hydroxylase-related dioxygenase (phytanoyl-CoA dioxygenase family)